MSFDKGYFQCDECPDYIDTDEQDFVEAMVIAKRNGWRSFRRNDKWMQVCPSCVVKFANSNRGEKGERV